MKPGPGHLRLAGLALIIGAILVFFFGPVSGFRAEIHFHHAGRWFGPGAMPYFAIFVIQCFGPSLVVMALSFVAGCILLIFNKPLSRDLARMSEMSVGEKTRLLSVAAITVALYTLSLAIFGAVMEYGYVQMDSYPGFRPLLRYATYVGLIALALFPLAEGARGHRLLLISGVALLLWAL